MFASGLEFLGLLIFGICLCLKKKFSRKAMEIDPESSFLANLLVVEKETVL